MAETVKCDARESAACCCVDVGTIIDNSDSKTVYENTFASQAEAESMLEKLIQKARNIESEPCQIQSQIEHKADGYHLYATFLFSCEAELLIFQLGLR